MKGCRKTLWGARCFAFRAVLGCLMVVGCSAGLGRRAHCQQTSSSAPAPAGTARSWAEDAVRHEVEIIASEGSLPLRFRERKIDGKGDTTREVIESREGTVARLVERNGKLLSSDEDMAERQRLQEAIDSPADFLRHHQKDKAARQDAIQVVRLLPEAMLYSYAPGQPQPKDAAGLQIVVDYHPNPKFHPPSMRAEVLTGIEGRVWIDAQSRRMTRIEGKVLHTVDLGYGVLARIFPGGELVLDQTKVGDMWVYRHLAQHVTVRVMMVKTIPEHVEMTSWDFRQMPKQLGYQDAIKTLLAMQVPLQ